MSTIVNIGLATNDGKGITKEQALDTLRTHGHAQVIAWEVRESNSEPTLIATIVNPLKPVEAYAVSVSLRQDCIAQLSGDAGELYGPAAAKWGPFNPEYFLTPTVA